MPIKIYVLFLIYAHIFFRAQEKIIHVALDWLERKDLQLSPSF